MVRLRLPLTLHALVLATGVALAALLAAGARAGEGIERVGAIGITVADLDRALAFYSGVLPFQVVSEAEVAGEAFEHLFGVFGLRARIARLRLGGEEIELIDYLAPEGRPIPADSRSNDAWFQHIAIIVSDMGRAYAQLRRHKVRHASSGPQTLPDWNPNAGGIKAFYFKDPDGNHLEILEFPAGKGDPRWQEADGQLFLGIDHTAIVVDDTLASLAFYRDRLGMAVAGASENWGPEQERLNNVFGARLRITALRAPAGPGIELLEYLAPGDGRPFPLDTRANDLWHWQVSLVTADLAAAAAPLRAGHDFPGLARRRRSARERPRLPRRPADARPGRPRDAAAREVTRRPSIWSPAGLNPDQFAAAAGLADPADAQIACPIEAVRRLGDR
jgi:catechol 2,3-dioxygenase-like lactoylglutathione lyase family enzyme